MLIRVAAVVLPIALFASCSRDGSSPDTFASSAIPESSAVSVVESTAGAGTLASSGTRDVRVNMQDACDPATFNAVLGPGTCVRAGGVKFDDFIAQLRRLTFVGSWHFAPRNANVRAGQTFLAMNLGGEVHTFTEVEEFGGGIVPMLNELARLPTVAPECNSLDSDDFVAPGETYTEDIEEPGVEKYQCCIHPWMRLEARISNP
jgi:plastocyanin